VANELTISSSLNFVKSGRSVGLQRNGIQADVTGLDYVKQTQNIGVTEEALDLGDISTNGWVMFVNRSASYEIRIRAASGAADLISMLPGEHAGPFRLKAAAPYAIAITGAAQLEMLLIEE
jgi:hypothetical protein